MSSSWTAIARRRRSTTAEQQFTAAAATIGRRASGRSLRVCCNNCYAARINHRAAKPPAIKAIQSGRRPNTAPADELAIFDFVKQLYRDRRVNDRLYNRVQKVLGNTGMVELVGILGYYAMISMMLNVFRAATAPDKPMPFREPLAV